MSNGKYWGGTIENIDFRVGGELKEPIEAFNELYEGMYILNEWGNEENPEHITGADYERGLDHWRNIKEDPNASIDITRMTDSGEFTKSYDIELRDDKDQPGDKSTPYSVMSAVSSDGDRIGIRILREYDPEILHRSGHICHPASNLTELVDWTNDEFIEDYQNRLFKGEKPKIGGKMGWIQEPQIQAALDRETGLDRRIANEDKYSGLVPLNPEKHVYVDVDRDPEYWHSNLDVLMVYDWMEDVQSGFGIKLKDLRDIGQHLGTLHALGIYNFDRSSDELLRGVYPESDERIVIENDYEFTMFTQNEEHLESDLEETIKMVDEITNKSTETVENEIRTARRNALESVNPTELRNLLHEQLPSEWDKDLFEDYFVVMD